MRRYILILIIAISSPLLHAQSSWTKEKAYVQLGISALYYNRAQINETPKTLAADNTNITTQIYTEYDLTNNLEVLLVVPVKLASLNEIRTNTSRNISGLRNLTFELKYRIYNQKCKISTGFQYQSNTSKKDVNTGLSTDFNANTFIPYLSAGTRNRK
jgi:hypothetical protein